MAKRKGVNQEQAVRPRGRPPRQDSAVRVHLVLPEGPLRRLRAELKGRMSVSVFLSRMLQRLYP